MKKFPKNELKNFLSSTKIGNHGLKVKFLCIFNIKLEQLHENERVSPIRF